MKTIWKYILPIQDTQTITMPRGSKPISVGAQWGSLCLWVEIDPREPENIEMPIEIRGTGHPLDGSEHHFLGTVVMHEGALVWHVYWRD